MRHLTVDEAWTALRYSNQGLIFSARFVKDNGEVRNILCRCGVNKDQNGVGMKYDPDESKNLIVWDFQKEAYRTIPARQLIRFKFLGMEFHVW